MLHGHADAAAARCAPTAESGRFRIIKPVRVKII
jgi:hypothetical protein